MNLGHGVVLVLKLSRKAGRLQEPVGPVGRLCPQRRGRAAVQLLKVGLVGVVEDLIEEVGARQQPPGLVHIRGDHGPAVAAGNGEVAHADLAL